MYQNHFRIILPTDIFYERPGLVHRLNTLVGVNDQLRSRVNTMLPQSSRIKPVRPVNLTGFTGINKEDEQLIIG